MHNQLVKKLHLPEFPLWSAHLLAMSVASLLGGGMVKHTEGTIASFPDGLITFHLAR